MAIKISRVHAQDYNLDIDTSYSFVSIRASKMWTQVYFINSEAHNENVRQIMNEIPIIKNRKISIDLKTFVENRTSASSTNQSSAI